MTGKIEWFNKQRGYGFITGDDGRDYFVQCAGIIGNRELEEGDSVKYDVIETQRGVQAVNVLRTSLIITDGETNYKITLLV